VPRTLGLLALSSLLYFLAFPKIDFAYVAWVALVPVVWAALEAPPRRAFFWAWLAGTIAHCGILFWVVITFRAANQSMLLSLVCLVLLSSYVGLYWGSWAWFTHRVKNFKPLPFALVSAAAWTGLEWIRTHLFSGFPWALLGDSQWRFIALIQVASLTGVYGVSFLIVFVNVSLARWRLEREHSVRAVWTPIIAGALLVITVIWGAWRMHSEKRPSLTAGFPVALLQGSIDQYQKWDKQYVKSIQGVYAALNREALRTHPALIVWPETAVPGYLTHEPELQDWLTSVIRRTGTTHVVGAPAMSPDRTAYNSAFVIDSDGQVMGQYDKKHLVPFGEIVPWGKVLGRWIKVLNSLGGFAAGKRSPVILSPIGPLGINICYEAVFPDLVRRSVRQGASYIINITNDGWYMKTSAPYQHFVPNVFRAVENRRWLMRADNTGISALIDPAGRVHAASPIFVPLLVTGTVWPVSEVTFYTLYGDVFAGLCLALCLAISLRGILRRR
jgi:apolipoprotein N-acyltransferase